VFFIGFAQIVSTISKENVMKASRLFTIVFLLLLVISACGPMGADTVNDFSIGASPATLTFAPGSSGISMIGTAVIDGSAGAVSLSASGLPVGVTAAFSVSLVAAGGSSPLTFVVDSLALPGNYGVTVTGTEGSMTHSATIIITIPAAVVNDFSIGASPASLSITQGSSGVTTIGTAVISGVAGSVSLTASGPPAGVTAFFNVSSVMAGGSSNLTIKVAVSVPAGIYHVTVTGAEGSMIHKITLIVTVLHKKDRGSPTKPPGAAAP
jgi:hypothetical protein